MRFSYSWYFIVFGANIARRMVLEGYWPFSWCIPQDCHTIGFGILFGLAVRCVVQSCRRQLVGLHGGPSASSTSLSENVRLPSWFVCLVLLPSCCVVSSCLCCSGAQGAWLFDADEVANTMFINGYSVQAGANNSGQTRWMGCEFVAGPVG